MPEINLNVFSIQSHRLNISFSSVFQSNSGVVTPVIAVQIVNNFKLNLEVFGDVIDPRLIRAAAKWHCEKFVGKKGNQIITKIYPSCDDYESAN